ncbi:MAG: tRNA (cytidine(34)-2'-O)-methyltransferase [Proteobacteria bacterium]|nr:tRNA (cytidine(34)-2'-O)-methyltransferase [Pseudomonadota bacterium]
MFKIALIEPQIPPNTGNIARLCGATNTRLEIVGNIGFELSDKQLRRAGLDYWKHVNWGYYDDTRSYLENLDPQKVHLLTTKSQKAYTECQFEQNDILMFGSETKGIDPVFMNFFPESWCTIPMENPEIRSLNLSSSVAIVLYEAIRQISFKK